MSLSALLSVTQITAVCAYALLGSRLIRSGRMEALRFFTAYILLMIVDLIWRPVSILEAMWIEPWLLYLRFCSVIEAVCLIANQRQPAQRHMLLFLLPLGAACGAQVIGVHPLTDMAGWYRTMRQTTHVALGMICLATCAYQFMTKGWKWDALWLPHGRILSVYILTRAVFSFLVRPERGADYHARVRIAALICHATLWIIWLWYDRRELRSRRLSCAVFKIPNPGT